MNSYLVIGLVGTALAGALWYSISLNLDSREALATAQTQLQEQKAENDTTGRQLAEARNARDRLNDRIRRLARQQNATQAMLEAERATRRKLEATNAEYRQWATSRLPDSVIGLLNDSPLNPHNPVSDLRHDQPAGGPGKPPQPSAPDEQRAPAGPD